MIVTIFIFQGYISLIILKLGSEWSVQLPRLPRVKRVKKTRLLLSCQYSPTYSSNAPIAYSPLSSAFKLYFCPNWRNVQLFDSDSKNQGNTSEMGCLQAFLRSSSWPWSKRSYHGLDFISTFSLVSGVYSVSLFLAFCFDIWFLFWLLFFNIKYR